MTNVNKALETASDPEKLAQAFLKDYFNGKQATYPINPFQMLTDMGVPFVFRPFKNYEGVYIPSEDPDDIPVVAINLKRPIARQRFTAAHELCHHIKDRNSGMMCQIGSRSEMERYAENFAAALLMPIGALTEQVKKYAVNGCVSFDDLLRIAHFFGVSFQSCALRVAYKLNAIDGDTSPKLLTKRITKYAPEKKRILENLENLVLYEGLFLAAANNLILAPSPNISYKFQNEYVYNDSRLEGVELELEQVAEIVTDIRLKKQDSEFCSSKYKDVIEVAGHAAMYQTIFEMAVQDKISIFDSLILNKQLYSCAPFPDEGGKTRDVDTLVLGAKFETVGYLDIYSELLKLEEQVQYIKDYASKINITEYIERAIQIHHRMTVIHPFSDGNGRTSRAFLNLLLIRNKIPPVYVKIENRKEYLSALSVADRTHNFGPLYEVFFKGIMQVHSDLTSFPEL